MFGLGFRLGFGLGLVLVLGLALRLGFVHELGAWAWVGYRACV